MKFLMQFCLVGITMAFPTPGNYIAQQNNEALTAAKSSRPQRHLDSQEPLYNVTYHSKRSAPEYRIHRRDALSYAPPRPTYKPKPTDKPVKPDYKAPPPTQAPAPHIIKRREAPSYAPQRPTYKPVKPDYIAAPPMFQAPPLPIYMYQQPEKKSISNQKR